MEPDPNDDRALMLATFAANGDIAGCQRVLRRDPGAVNEPGVDGTTPLCAAATWGHVDLLRSLLQALASPGLRNENGPQWTALHAAALQEEGKACMLLLDAKANPLDRDVEGVTPCDYGSCSEAIWPLFAAAGCTRTAKTELVRLGVIRKASSSLEAQLQAESSPEAAEAAEAAGLPVSTRRGLLDEYSRPGSSYVVTREFPPRPGSVAGSARTPSSRRGNSRPIDILEEEDSRGPDSATAGLRSLQI